MHVLLSINSITQDGIAALIENSPNLIVCAISTYALVLCGAFYLMSEDLNQAYKRSMQKGNCFCVLVSAWY